MSVLTSVRRGALRGMLVAGFVCLLQACGGGGSPSTAAAEAPLPSLPPPAVPTVGSATLSWTPPLTHTDGSTLSDLAGYTIHYGTSAGNYTSSIRIANPGISSYTVDDLTNGTYFFVVTAFDSHGVESDFSTPVSKKIG